MKASTLLTRFAGALGSNLQGFTPLEILQAVIDDLWADDVLERMTVPAPYVTTVAGTLVYHFDANNDQSLTPIIPSVSTIRRVRGLFKPALTQSNISDYNYKALIPFDQNVLRSRLYDGSTDIDNERRKVTFRADPGTSTTTWKVDSYPKAPTLDDDSDIPVLPGTEMTLVFPGMRAFAEEWKTGASEFWRPKYDMEKVGYHLKIRMDTDLPKLDENLYFFGDKLVEPQ